MRFPDDPRFRPPPEEPGTVSGTSYRVRGALGGGSAAAGPARTGPTGLAGHPGATGASRARTGWDAFRAGPWPDRLRIAWRVFLLAFLVTTALRFTGSLPRPVARGWDTFVSALVPGQVGDPNDPDTDFAIAEPVRVTIMRPG